MLKQEINLKFKKKKIRKGLKKYKRNRQLLKKINSFNKTFLKISKLKNLNLFHKINIRATSNNVFCTLVDIKSKKTLNVAYAGKYKIKTSKRTLKFSSKVIIENFLKEINERLKTFVFISLILPKRIKRKTIKLLKKSFKNKKVILNVIGKKCFNGCRPSKKKRKKRKGFRIFK